MITLLLTVVILFLNLLTSKYRGALSPSHHRFHAFGVNRLDFLQLLITWNNRRVNCVVLARFAVPITVGVRHCA